MSACPDRPLRSRGVKSGFAVALVSRSVRFLTTLVLARAIILNVGPKEWAVLALSWAVCDLVSLVDFAIHELCVYEAAAAPSRESLRRSMGQALLLSVIPAGLGTLTLLACALGAARGFGFAAGYAGPDLVQLFLAAAASYAIGSTGRVYSGTLQGLGWIRELNSVALGMILIDFVVVVVGLSGGLGIVGISWARAALAPVGFLFLLGTLRRLGLPIAWPASPDPVLLWRMLRYAVRYNINRGLGAAVAGCSTPIAQRFVPAADLGAFGAADQWAGKLRKFSDVVWESLFHRLVPCFRSDALPSAREDGRLQYLAASLGMSLFVVPAGLALILVSPWLFPIWLNAERAALPVVLLPGLVAAWCLNSTASPSTCAILASNQFRLSAWIHAVALVASVLLAIVLTHLRGIVGTVEAMVASNALLTAMLSCSACRLCGASWWRWLRSNATPYAVALLGLILEARWESTAAKVTIIGLAVCVSVVVAFRARSIRLSLEIVRRPGGAV